VGGSNKAVVQMPVSNGEKEVKTKSYGREGRHVPEKLEGFGSGKVLKPQCL